MRKQRQPSARDAGPADIYIGEKIREARKAVGLSQTALGAKLGISCQQMQKYENGHNRVTAVRLYEICAVLDLDMMSILDRMPKAPR